MQIAKAHLYTFYTLELSFCTKVASKKANQVAFKL